MRVAFDATPLVLPAGGIPRYTVELRRALEALHPEDEYLFLSDQPVLHQPDWPAHWNVPPIAPSVVNRRWWLAGLPLTLRRLGVDLFHGTDFAVPYVPVSATVLSLHDLSPWMDAAWHNEAARVRQRTPLLLRLGLATMVLTLSESVRRAAIERFTIPTDRIVAVPLAASEHFRPQPKRPGPAPYFLYVGTLEPRKNLEMLVNAWRPVWEQHGVELVLAGRRRSDGPEFTSGQGLRLPGSVSDMELPSLYSNALAVVYPTLYEGFGLPVLEAMQCGAAVLTSLDPSVLEVTGSDAALHLPADDREAWTAAMTSCVEQPAMLSDLRQRALERAAVFSWRETARRTYEVYEEARRRFRFRSRQQRSKYP